MAYRKRVHLLGVATCLVMAGCASGRPGARDSILVFILAGQSNMQGQGVVEMDHEKYYNGGKGNLVHVLKHANDPAVFAHLRDSQGNWTVREDVRVRYRREGKEVMTGSLTVGFTGYGGRSHIGPELQIGHRLGDCFEEPVLLIKTAWGGKSLNKDFRPPGAGGETGPYYTRMISEVKEGIAAIDVEFPDLKVVKLRSPAFSGFRDGTTCSTSREETTMSRTWFT